MKKNKKRKMAKKLSQEEINKRLIKLRNYERLYPELQRKYKRLKVETDKKIAEQKAHIDHLTSLLETAFLRIEELERMIFGGGPKKRAQADEGSPEEDGALAGMKKEKKQRSKDSYKRAIPNKVDEEKLYPLEQCPDCLTKLTDKKIRDQYLEDIILPTLEETPATHVIKERVEKGYCKNCRKWKAAKAVQPSPVMLGPKVKTFIHYATYVLGLSTCQVKEMLLGMYGFAISEGEIISLQERASKTLLPEYEGIKGRIRGQPGNHFDETSWLEGKERRYAWVQVGNETEEAVFMVGETRGKGVAEKLKEDSQAVGITDCYGAYKHLFERHQICWAHLTRTARDLKNSPSLPKNKILRCKKVYSKLSELYARLLTFHKNEFDEGKGKALKKKLMKQIRRLRESKPNDPKKLKNLLQRLKTYEHALLVCLEKPGIPPDNNKAERKIRKLVLKRKNSFGTKTPKGSHAFSINMSVALSQWWMDPKKWFSNMHALLNPAE